MKLQLDAIPAHFSLPDSAPATEIDSAANQQVDPDHEVRTLPQQSAAGATLAAFPAAGRSFNTFATANQGGWTEIQHHQATPRQDLDVDALSKGNFGHAWIYNSLPSGDKKLITDAIRDSGDRQSVIAEMRSLIESPQFRRMSPDEKTSSLNRIAILNSRVFGVLSAAGQQSIRHVLNHPANGDLKVPASLRSLINSGNFQALPGPQKSAVLGMARTYPDSRSLSNLGRLLDQNWFQRQGTADQVRSMKFVAHLSQSNGDPTITRNTLDRLLTQGNYDLEWAAFNAQPSALAFGHASGKTVTLNRDFVGADSQRPIGAVELYAIQQAPAHEVNHLVNGDQRSATFKYLNAEHRAWYVGFLADRGSPPTNQQAMVMWEYLLKPNSGYAAEAHGVETALPFGWGDTPGALDKPDEASKVFQALSHYTGLSLNATNYLQAMNDPGSWKTNPGDPASSSVYPAGDDLDN